MPKAIGVLQQVVPKTTQAGKQYFTICVDDTWYSIWEPVNMEIGSEVEVEFTTRGQYKNATAIRQMSGVPQQAGARARLVGADKDRAITRMAVTRTAAQMLSPFPPKKGETPKDRLNVVFNLAAILEDYVYDRTPEVKEPQADVPASTPTEEADDSVFPTE